MNYLTIVYNIKALSNNMCSQICSHMDKYENRQYNYYFALVNEIYKGLALCCDAIEIQAYSQIGTLIRQLIEQVATAKIIITNEKVLSAYSLFAKAKLFSLQHNNDNCELDKLYVASSLSKREKRSKKNFYSLGWLESLGVKDISPESLIKVAELNDLYNWRSFCNNFVHSSLTFLNFVPDGVSHLIKDFIYIIAVLCDVISCSYHNFTGFKFVVNGKDLYQEFRKEFMIINDYLKNYNNCENYAIK